MPNSKLGRKKRRRQEKGTLSIIAALSAKSKFSLSGALAVVKLVVASIETTVGAIEKSSGGQGWGDKLEGQREASLSLPE